MKLIQIYSFTGCREAGGPWEDVIDPDIPAQDIFGRAEKWCDDIRAHVAAQEVPRTMSEWRFTTQPDNLNFHRGWIAVMEGKRHTLTVFYGQGEYYELILLED